MAALDSVSSPNSPLKNSGFLDEFFPNWTQFCPNPSAISLPHLESSSIDASNHESSCLINTETSVTEKQGTQSLLSSMAEKAESGEQVTQVLSPPLDKKRKSRRGSSSNSANSKDPKQAKAKKQKGEKEANKDDKNDKEDQNKANLDEPPKGYIHVRARRGQATDSHSLAERVRREKISERMKMLQALVPGCDKVTGKALMLDEIINYVQSLQNQVEFLSMRLASLDPMVYNFGLMDVDPVMPFRAQGIMNNNTLALPLPPIQSPTTTSPMSFSDKNPITATIAATAAADTGITTTAAATTAAFPNPNNVIDSSDSLLLHDQKPTVIHLQDDRSLYWGSGVNEQQRLSFFNQFGFGANNWYYI